MVTVADAGYHVEEVAKAHVQFRVRHEDLSQVLSIRDDPHHN